MSAITTGSHDDHITLFSEPFFEDRGFRQRFVNVPAPLNAAQVLRVLVVQPGETWDVEAAGHLLAPYGLDASDESWQRSSFYVCFQICNRVGYVAELILADHGWEGDNGPGSAYVNFDEFAERPLSEAAATKLERGIDAMAGACQKMLDGYPGFDWSATE